MELLERNKSQGSAPSALQSQSSKVVWAGPMSHGSARLDFGLPMFPDLQKGVEGKASLSQGRSGVGFASSCIVLPQGQAVMQNAGSAPASVLHAE